MVDCLARVKGHVMTETAKDSDLVQAPLSVQDEPGEAVIQAWPIEGGLRVELWLTRREDGGLRIHSDTLPGLILSGAIPSAVLRDLGPAINALVSHEATRPDARTNASGTETVCLKQNCTDPRTEDEKMSDAPLAVSVARAAELIDVSVPTLYRMRRDEQIEFRKVRGRTIVPMSEVARICNGEPKRDAVGEPVVEPVKRRVQKTKLVPQLT